MWDKRIFLQSVLIVIVFLVFGLGKSLSYPGGTPNRVTDMAPFCASCHSVCSKKMLRNMPEAVQESQLFTMKHYSLIENGQKNYEKMKIDERKTLLSDVKKVDENAFVRILTPIEVEQEEDIDVKIDVRGGSGPVVGVMLLDNDLTWQSRSVTADGWQIRDEPKVIGPDGNVQTAWISRRAEGLKRNINYVVIYGIRANISENKWQKSSVIYTLKTPNEKGIYTIAAAFLFGTEKASDLGYTQTIRGKFPIGGHEGASGRIMFSNVVRIKVK